MTRLHETAELKIHELIDKGDEHRVQWGSLLEAFAGLDEARMILALTSLNPNQLSSIADACFKAKKESRERAIEAAKANLSRLGITIDDLLPAQDVSRSTKVSNSNKKRVLLSKEARVFAKSIVSNKDYEHCLGEVKSRFGETLTKSNYYSMRSEAKKAGLNVDIK